MAEYSEYQRRRSRTVRERSPKHGYGKKFVLQLITSIVIFTAVCTPLSPEILKTAAKSALKNPNHHWQHSGCKKRPRVCLNIQPPFISLET